jgi:hypothetical protein
MSKNSGMAFGTTFGVVGGVLLGVFVHLAFLGLLPLGICIGLLFDANSKKRDVESNE